MPLIIDRSATRSRDTAGASAAELDPDSLIPTPPALRLELPALVLLHHPEVVSSEREVAARWSEIAIARADRLPRFDLAAALSGNWLRAFSNSAAFSTWSYGGQVGVPLIDGGAGAANVRIAQARYRQSVADLQSTVREVAQNVEDALAAQQSAALRVETSRRAVEAGRLTVRGKEASWRAGTISLFELEDAHRAFNAVQENAIAALRDRAVSWVNLIRASGTVAVTQSPKEVDQ